MAGFNVGEWERLADADSLTCRVRAVRLVAAAAAAGDAEAGAWLAGHFQSLANLLTEVEAALTSRN